MGGGNRRSKGRGRRNNNTNGNVTPTKNPKSRNRRGSDVKTHSLSMVVSCPIGTFPLPPTLQDVLPNEKPRMTSAQLRLPILQTSAVGS
ncbi:hypothetical protein DEO72_LG2g870 [Vigna unguiculata]|uniref:Uncharacterized protein n=1 Tax=Vigna unguiculata TaxID=3917 RepID=A0A4D6KY56_VIGUN|nr:hypothetical protein DEO72_LG2g870 [Vigna unguiculata]